MFDNPSVHDRGDNSAPSSAHIHPQSPQFQVRICQHTSCTKQGAVAVLQAFQNQQRPHAEIVATGCLGCCGQGPMVLVLPDDTWYSHVNPEDVKAIAAQHLTAGKPVTALLDRAHYDRHPAPPVSTGQSLLWAYGALGLAVLGAIASIGWTFWLL